MMNSGCCLNGCLGAAFSCSMIVDGREVVKDRRRVMQLLLIVQLLIL